MQNPNFGSFGCCSELGNKKGLVRVFLMALGRKKATACQKIMIQSVRVCTAQQQKK
jgi:hypothetical protein